jgi:hypothetical protein
MFVTPDDFNLIPYNIPNLQQVTNTFPLYIEEKERRVLSRLLGMPLYLQFVAGLKALPPEWEAPPVSYIIGDLVTYGVGVWQALVDGTTTPPVEGTDWTLVEVNYWLRLKLGGSFLYSDFVHTWVGMKAMLVPYIYSQWLRDTYDSHAGIGIVESKAENANVISPAKRISDAFNEFSIMAGTYIAGDPFYDSSYLYYGYQLDSLAGFLYASNYNTTPAPYATWEGFVDSGFMNTFGL